MEYTPTTQHPAIVIPWYILTDNRLAQSEKIVFGLIFQDNNVAEYPCTLTNSQLGTIVGISANRMSGIISKLNKLNLISVEIIRGTKKEVISREISVVI